MKQFKGNYKLFGFILVGEAGGGGGGAGGFKPPAPSFFASSR